MPQIGCQRNHSLFELTNLQTRYAHLSLSRSVFRINITKLDFAYAIKYIIFGK